MFLCSGLHQTDVDSLLPALQFSCCVLFNICFSVSVPVLLLATFAKDNCPIMPHWEHFWGLLHCNIGNDYLASLELVYPLHGVLQLGHEEQTSFFTLLKHYFIHEYLFLGLSGRFFYQQWWCFNGVVTNSKSIFDRRIIYECVFAWNIQITWPYISRNLASSDT